MNALHRADLKTRLSRFIARRDVPRRLEAKPEAINDELSALTATVERFAPRDAEALANWWGRFEVQLGLEADRYWPTEKQIAEAAKAIAPASGNRPREKGDTDEARIAADRMNAGEPVGEGWLYGTLACDMIERRLVDEPTMRKYRSKAYFHRKDVLGAEAADAWEADRKAMHDRVREDRRQHAQGKVSPAAIASVMARFGSTEGDAA